MRIKRVLAGLVFFAATFAVQAASYNASNGHYYQLVNFSDIHGRLDWNAAEAYAETLAVKGVRGHLATLTSKSEDDFVWGLGAQGYFLGASDTSTKNGDGEWVHDNQWKWVTGETFSYSNFFDGEPNNWLNMQENYLMTWWFQSNGHRWNDTTIDSGWMDDSRNINYTTQGFVVEYDTNPVPVPPALWLFASGLALLGWRKKQ